MTTTTSLVTIHHLQNYYGIIVCITVLLSATYYILVTYYVLKICNY